VQVLLEAGADTDQATTEDHESTPLFISAMNGHVEEVVILRAAEQRRGVATEEQVGATAAEPDI
jgi:hypothetical protein